MYRSAVKLGDDVTTNEARFVRWRARSFYVLKGDANIAVSCFKVIDSGIRLRYRGSRSATRSPNCPRYLLEECRKNARGNEEDTQTYEHPGGAANLAPTASNSSGLGDRHRAASKTVRAGIWRVGMGHRARRCVLKANCLSVLSRSFP